MFADQNGFKLKYCEHVAYINECLNFFESHSFSELVRCGVEKSWKKMNRRMWNRGLMLSIVLAIVISTQSVNSQRPRLGRALNILRRFGHLARVMRVMALNVSGSWIYREPSIQIFQTRPESGARFARKVLRGTQAEIQIHYCSNPQKLVQKYFRPFIIEGLKEPAYAFERNWCHSAIARHFGINASYIGNDYKYVLLKVMRRHRKSIMMGPPSKFIVQEAVARETRSLIANDTFSADRFINKFGTHYVSSFVTGDFIYQVRKNFFSWFSTTQIFERWGIFKLRGFRLLLFLKTLFPGLCLQTRLLSVAQTAHKTKCEWIVGARQKHFLFTLGGCAHRKDTIGEWKSFGRDLGRKTSGWLLQARFAREVLESPTDSY